MALVVKDRVKQTTTTTGTGSIVLNGTVDGFQTFAAALANGDTTYYSIFEVSTNAYEIGLGTWNESTSTLARTTVLESSNSGSAINLTAQAEVFITYPAEKSVFLDSNGDVTLGNDLVVTGDFTVNGTTTTVNTTNSVVSDALIELGNGTSGTPSNDAGIVIERGSSDNAFIGYDESADKFTVGTGSFTGASTGNLTISTGTLVANIEGNVTGDVTGNVSGSSGSTTGNAATATALQNARTIAGQSFDGTANITIAPTDLTGVSADAAEINILDGVTSTTAELNLLDGVTATTTELNYVDGVTSAIQTQLDAKASLSGATFTGDVTVDTNTLHVDSSNNRVGIGTISPDVLLDVENSSASEIRAIRDGGKSVHLYADASNAILAYKTGDLRIGETSSTVSANLTERMRIDSSGNLLLGSSTYGGYGPLQVGSTSTASTVIQMLSATNGYNTIHFGDATSGAGRYAGYIQYNNNSDAMLLATGSAERMRIDSSGNVGIGTSSPDSFAIGNLVVGSGSGAEGITIYSANDDEGIIRFADGTTGAEQYQGQVKYDHSGNFMRFYTAATERLRIDSSGNVGIGTSSPSQKLDISAGYLNFSNGYGIRWGGNTTEAIYGNNTGNLIGFQTNGSEAMRIDSSGNVGIGTSSPSRDLTIKGFTGFEASNSTNAWVVYTYTDNTFRLNYNGSGNDEVVIDSSGNFMVATTSTGPAVSNSITGIALGQSGYVAASRSGDASGFFNRLSSDGAIVYFNKDGSTVGSVGAASGDMYIGTGDTGVRFSDGVDAIYPISASTGFSRDAAIDLGYSTVRYKDGYFSGNLIVGSTVQHDGDSNTYLGFGTDNVELVAGGTQRLLANTDGVTLSTKIDIPDDVYLGWGGGSNRPSIQGNKNSGTLEFFVGGGERLQIDGTNSTFYTDIVAEDHDLYVGDFSGGNMGRLTFDSANGRGFTYEYDNAFVISNAQGTTEQYLVLGDSATSSNETLLGISTYLAGTYYTRMQLTGIGDLILPNGSLREDWDSLVGANPTIANAGAYSLTMSGNTTFTFPSPTSGYSTSFILQLTGNGGTVTYPASVDWAGGTAPDAPGNGETDILVFWTRDGGTTWFGALSIDAAA